jgi:tRNA threonylcarbamoyladenosine biosynthesis protein TsaE
MKEGTFEIDGLNELKIFAEELSEYLKEGDFVALVGNLGVGKTALVKATCLNYGINEVNSPSFAIVNEYYGKRLIYHLDFYRIKDPGELVNIGYYEYINDAEAIKFVEWADMFPNVLPAKRIEIKIKYIKETKRKIFVKRYE